MDAGAGTSVVGALPSSQPRLVSRAQRAKLLRQNKVFQKERRESNLRTLDVLWDPVERAACSSSSLANGNADWGLLPSFLDDAHPSHKLVTVGGFLACRWCGRLACISAGKLQDACRRFIPKGGQEPLHSLLHGVLPRHWSSWPDGGEGLRRPWVVKSPGSSGRPCEG